jgi:hypothetical protein
MRIFGLIVGGKAVAFHGHFGMVYNSDGNIANKFDLDIGYNSNSCKNDLEDIKQFD